MRHSRVRHLRARGGRYGGPPWQGSPSSRWFWSGASSTSGGPGEEKWYGNGAEAWATGAGRGSVVVASTKPTPAGARNRGVSPQPGARTVRRHELGVKSSKVCADIPAVGPALSSGGAPGCRGRLASGVGVGPSRARPRGWSVGAARGGGTEPRPGLVKPRTAYLTGRSHERSG